MGGKDTLKFQRTVTGKKKPKTTDVGRKKCRKIYQWHSAVINNSLKTLTYAYKWLSFYFLLVKGIC